MIGLFGRVVDQFSRGLTYATARHLVLARNIANSETPGYRPRDLVFEDYLKVRRRPRARRGLCPSRGRRSSPRRGSSAGRRAGAPDGNNVHLDKQMAPLAENTLYQHTLVQLSPASSPPSRRPSPAGPKETPWTSSAPSTSARRACPPTRQMDVIAENLANSDTPSPPAAARTGGRGWSSSRRMATASPASCASRTPEAGVKVPRVVESGDRLAAAVRARTPQAGPDGYVNSRT